MSNDLANYSLEELAEIQVGIDRDKHPTRYDEVSSLIDKQISQQLANEPVRRNEGFISNKLVALSCVASVILGIRLYTAIQTGVLATRRGRSVTVTEDPTIFWFGVTVLIFGVSAPLILLVQKRFSKKNKSAE